MDENKFRQAQIYVLKILKQVDIKQAKRYENLKFPATLIATKGILRHFQAWRREAQTDDQLIARVDASAIREIIDDALNGIEIYKQANNDLAKGFESNKAKTHRYN